MNRREFLSLFNPVKLVERFDVDSSPQKNADRNTLFKQVMALGIDPANLSVEDLEEILVKNEKNH